MKLGNTPQGYGAVSIAIHWLTALAVVFLFGLGWWMTDLEYYDRWYKIAPHIHKSIGILLFFLTLARLAWISGNPRLQPPPRSPQWERRAAALVHGLLYVLLLALMTSGYLISTADGRGIAVFNWLEIPALPWRLEHQEDIAGEIHAILAYALIGLALLHAAAALKHHFIDRDNILRRMLGLP
jgi:cytochrome b561